MVLKLAKQTTITEEGSNGETQKNLLERFVKVQPIHLEEALVDNG